MRSSNDGKRQPSHITVTIVDVKRLIEHNENKWRDYSTLARYDEFFVPHKLGFVEVGDEIFFIDSEGIGGVDAITDNNPLQMGIYGRFTNEKGKRCFSMVPVDLITLTPEIFRFYAAEQVPLEDFIRTHNSRLESNYCIALKFFRKKGLGTGTPESV